MSKVRNAIAIIVLCIIGGYTYRKYLSNGSANNGQQDQLKDALAESPAVAPSHHHKLKLNGNDDQINDSLAESPAIPNGQSLLGGGPNSNFHGGNGTPRGNSNGGFNPGGRPDLPQQHQGSKNLSPFGPQS